MQKGYVTPNVKIFWREQRNVITSSGEALIVDAQSDNLFSTGEGGDS